MAKEWTKDTLRAWFAELAERGTADRSAITPEQRGVIMRGLLFLYERQTADEQHTGATSHANGMGFSGIDARFSNFGREIGKAVRQHHGKPGAARRKETCEIRRSAYGTGQRSGGITPHASFNTSRAATIYAGKE